MPKKKKRKINKKIIEERLRALQSSAGREQEKAPKTEKKKKEEKQAVLGENEYIFSDMRKLLYFTLIIFLVFAILIFLNIYTNQLDKASIEIFRILSVGQL